MDTPQTAEEAIRQGYKTERKSSDEANAIVRQGVSGRDLRLAAKPRDCSEIPSGALCWEGDCDASGWKEVLYCDDTQGCTLYAKVRCTPKPQ